MADARLRSWYIARDACRLADAVRDVGGFTDGVVHHAWRQRCRAFADAHGVTGGSALGARLMQIVMGWNDDPGAACNDKGAGRRRSAASALLELPDVPAAWLEAMLELPGFEHFAPRIRERIDDPNAEPERHPLMVSMNMVFPVRTIRDEASG